MTDTTNNPSLPKVGEPVEILYQGGGLLRDLVQGYHGEAFYVRGLGLKSTFDISSENQVPGWRRVERQLRAGETVKCWPLNLDGSPATVGEWSRHKVESIDDVSFRPVGMLRRWLSGRGETWDFDDEPASEPSHDQTPYFGGGEFGEPTLPPGTIESERERGAYTLYQAGQTLGAGGKEWSELTEHVQLAWLDIYDRAGELFAAKARRELSSMEDFAGLMVKERDAARAEVERLKARLDDYQRAAETQREGIAYLTAENERLKARVEELVGSLRDVLENTRARQARNDQYVEPCRAYLDAQVLLARIDAERKGKEDKAATSAEQPFDELRDRIIKGIQEFSAAGYLSGACEAFVCAMKGAWRAARAEGRREAFAEAENQFRHLCDCKLGPWLREQANYQDRE